MSHYVSCSVNEAFSSTDVEVQWCSLGDLLAVAGMERRRLPADSACASTMRNALVKFYNVQGEHIYTLETPAQVSRLHAVHQGWVTYFSLSLS